MTPTKQATKTPIEGPLSILVSARMRLTKEERNLLKDAYNAAKRAELGSQPPSPNGSPIKVVSASLTGTDLDQRLGMSSLVMNDVLNARDSLNLPLVLHLQKVLGVEVISKKRLMEALKGYADHVFSAHD